MSVDLRYVNPKISPFVDPGGPTKTERFEPVSSKFSKFYKYKLLSKTVLYPKWRVWHSDIIAIIGWNTSNVSRPHLAPSELETGDNDYR